MCVVGGIAVSAVYNFQTPPENQAETTNKDKVEKTSYQKITAEEVYEMQQKEEPFTLVDVRTQKEFEEEHLSGAVLIPSDEISEVAEEKLPDKDAVIIVYCRSGGRSQMVANQLIEMGYKNVYDLGGILDWPYETDRNNK